MPARIRVEIHQELGTSSSPAQAFVRVDNKLAVIVTASIVYQPGADGGQYPCVQLECDTPDSKSSGAAAEGCITTER
jgi:hypothetical protein